ncbi:replication factor C subunit 1 isoform X1 [Harpegnathos saltator]|uniref:replication factor C subunit 1 isoform X1 n=1 Tax=Harpegnathos saltator TaxID=610380 RepID=UPI000DBED050|nr:replication factor C subunit 1 isoform X1 [Harpegnathos saltator]XP_019699160.2 replication factor C subunit 1 isoform X1 [Harpegnathos saltator]
MKDIKQYFANGSRIDKKIVDSNDNTHKEHMEEEQEDDFIVRANRKRKRVKIRISRTGSEERICNIIESKNDLIDKTPSPFGKTNDNSRISQDETVKSDLTSSSTKRHFEKFAVALVGNKPKSMKNISQDINNEIDKNKQIVNLIDSSNDILMENIHDRGLSNAKFCDDIGSQREESNAFQVLMSRSKPIQYKSLPQQSVEDIECNIKSSDIKELKAKHKEKLIALADKKGYSKRKLAETEEGEKIEKNIENRLKFFKGDNGNNDNSALSIKNNKQLSGSLLNYFSKSSLELTNKEMKCVSTIIVKADVHRTETASIEPVLKPISNKIYPIKRYLKANMDLSKVDDIHVIASENLTLPLTPKQEKQQKPRWSLRIKLHSSEDNDNQDGNDTTDDELFSPRSRSKFNVITNKSQKDMGVYVKNDKSHIKHRKGHVDTTVRNEKKNESFSKQEDNVQANIDKDSPANNKASDTCTSGSEKISKTKETFNGTCGTVITITDNSEDEIVIENILKKPNEKLAPLFTKRRKTDPAVVAAKRLFLQSDIIDGENKNTDRKLNNSILMLPFPIISHVTQLEKNFHLNKFKFQHRFPAKVEKKYLPSININEYKCITNYKIASKVTEAIDKPVKGNFDLVLLEMEERCPNVQKMWQTISAIKGKTEKKPLPRTKEGKKTKSLNRKGSLAENVETSQSHNCTWICKYKPMSAQEVVGNEEAAAKLRDWLSGWRTPLSKEDYSSGEEFYSSDSCSNLCNNESNQTAVLLGPHGSGKSASVYAVAEELGYSVLEVNASSRRTGKRILKELEEATKSHRIKKNKRKSPFEQATKKNEVSEISQNSLILLEDIDLIFEEDEGFVSAAYQLASNTKRPIVMTCRNVCPHLSKMAPQQNKIYFQQVNGSRVSALLELISLAETGYRLPHNCLVKLLQAGDLRKALLQLQYLLLSGPPVLSDQSTTVRPSLWQDMQRYLYKPAIKLKRHDTKKDMNAKKYKGRTMKNDILCSLADDLDGLSLVSSLIDIDDALLNSPEADSQPNLSLTESLSLYSAAQRCSADIANFISDRILYKNSNGNKHMPNSSTTVLRNQLNRGVDLVLSHVTFACLDHRVMATDYLSTARTICRAEEFRSAGNHKRGNRFFHYLHSLKVPASSLKPNILTAACRTLQEKVDKNASTSSTQ